MLWSYFYYHLLHYIGKYLKYDKHSKKDLPYKYDSFFCIIKSIYSLVQEVHHIPGTFL